MSAILDTEAQVCFNGLMSNDAPTPAPTTAPVPNLDADTLKHRFVGKRYVAPSRFNPTYTIERSINDGPFYRIGNVTRVKEARHPGDHAEWTAVAVVGDVTYRVTDDSRQSAAEALERRMQPEWAERKRIQYQERMAAERLAKEQEATRLVQEFHNDLDSITAHLRAGDLADTLRATHRPDAPTFSAYQVARMLASLVPNPR